MKTSKELYACIGSKNVIGFILGIYSFHSTYDFDSKIGTYVSKIVFDTKLIKALR